MKEHESTKGTAPSPAKGQGADNLANEVCSWGAKLGNIPGAKNLTSENGHRSYEQHGELEARPYCEELLGLKTGPCRCEAMWPST